MTQTARQLIMLRPMQPGLSGYARLQAEGASQLIQINIRGAEPGTLRAFWYAGEGVVRQLGQTPVNPRGEASLSAELPADTACPGRVSALLIASGADQPKPMMIGLCSSQSAGSLLDAKNALLALCDKLARQQRKQQETAADTAKEECAKAEGTQQETPPAPNPKSSPVRRSAAARRRTRHSSEDAPPREVFLPAIDPASCLRKQEKHCPAEAEANAREVLPDKTVAEPSMESKQPTETSPPSPPLSPPQRAALGEPVTDLLPPLDWPSAFASLKPYFLKLPPCRVMEWPGWRFVQVNEGRHRLWLGYLKENDRVTHVAYALPQDASAPGQAAFRPCTGADGQPLKVLVQRAEG